VVQTVTVACAIARDLAAMLQAAGTDNLTPWNLQADIMNGVDPSPHTLQAAVTSKTSTEHL
jgi:hypothetical protein